MKANGKMRVLALFLGGLVNEKSRVSAPDQKSVRTNGLSCSYAMNRIAIIFTVVALFGCSDNEYTASKTGEAIYSELKANNFENIDLSKLGGDDWTKVCFLGPYNEMSEKTLGFNWQVSEHTDVLKSDGHNVIVFATESEVIEYVVHSRGRGDFSQLSGECFSRNNSNFIQPFSGL